MAVEDLLASLEIVQCTVEESGDYVCVASSEAGSDRCSSTVTVKGWFYVKCPSLTKDCGNDSAFILLTPLRLWKKMVKCPNYHPGTGNDHLICYCSLRPLVNQRLLNCPSWGNLENSGFKRSEELIHHPKTPTFIFTFGYCCFIL